MLLKICHHETDIKTAAGHLVQVNKRIIAECGAAIGRWFTNIIILNRYTGVLLVKVRALVKEHGAVTMAVKYYGLAVQLFGTLIECGLLFEPVEYGHHGAVILKNETLRVPLNAQNGAERG